MTTGPGAIFLFSIGEKLLGLKLADVDRVLPAAELLDTPQSSPGLAGFLNYQGQAIPIMFLSELLGLPVRTLRVSDRIVLARAWNALVGLIVDEALGVYESSRMQPIPAEFEALNISPDIEGFVQVGEKMVVIQNLQKFLATSMTCLVAPDQETGNPMGDQPV
jgi:chemotaxis signal transduction protein